MNIRQYRLSITTALAAAAIAGVGGAAPAWAQTAPTQRVSPTRSNVLEEVVVTGSRRRKEDVQKTPIAVTALSPAILDRNHITNFAQVGKLAPNLSIENSLGSSGLAVVYYRGFGNQSNDPSVDPRIAIYVDGIYQPSSVGSLFDTFDLDGIEIDGGPQGTLLGKNAPVGAIFINNAKPTNKFGGAVQADYGSYDAYGLRAKINIPLLKDSAGQNILTSHFSVSDTQGGNWVYNIAAHQRDLGGNNRQAYRAAFSFNPTPEFGWDVNAIYSHDKSPQGSKQSANYVGGVPGTVQNATQAFPYPCLFDQLGIGPVNGCQKLPYGVEDVTYSKRPDTDQENIASNMHYTFYPVTATLVAGYAGLWQSDNLDDSGTPYVALNAYGDLTRYDQESAELRISSNAGHGADFNGLLDWVAGAFFSNYAYSNSNHLGIGVAQGFQLPVGVANVNQFQNGQTKSEALFLHTILHLTKSLSATFGFRHSWDQKNHDALLPGAPAYVQDPEADFSNNTFEAGLAYQIDPRKLVYFRFAQGYEAGGFGGFATGNTYEPETNNAYSLGFKTDWLDKRLRVNAEVFRNELSNLQVASAQAIPTPPFFLQETLNAGAAIVQGLETQITAVPFDALVTHLNLGYLDAHYTKNFSTACGNPNAFGVTAPQDCSGNNLDQSPKWTIDVGADYTFDLPHELGSTTLSGDWNYKAHAFTSDPVYPASYQKAYGLLRAGVVFRDISQRYSLEVYGTNILNKKYITSFTDPGGLAGWDALGRPAEWGLRLTGKF